MAMNREQRRHHAREQAGRASALRDAAEQKSASPRAILAACHRLFEMGRMRDALPALRRACALHPSEVPLRFALAYALATTGDTAAAVEEYRALLRQEPDSAQLLTNLAVLLIGAGGADDEAQQLLLRASEVAPAHADAAYSLAELLEKRKRTHEAFQHYRRAVTLYTRRIGDRPGPAQCNDMVKLATALMRTGDVKRAVSVFDLAVAIRPNHAEALASRGLALAQLRQVPQAIESLRRAAAVEPDLAVVRRAMGDLLATAGHNRAAAAEFRKALRINPKDAVTSFFLAAAQKDPGAAATPAAYVQQLFDDYAGRFDKHLVEILQYRSPELLTEAVRKIAAPPLASWTIMDLGCGTGLCGPLLRPYAKHLIGVDLSGRMLVKARERGVYDKLFLDDLQHALGRFESEIDLAVSADVMEYVGSLDGVFAGVRRALRPHGWFAFTTEALDGEGFVLDATRRYHHSLAYLQAEAAAHSLEIVHSEVIVARYESSRPAHANLSILRRPA
jgi:predicted TPR repeat methyltransferase